MIEKSTQWMLDAGCWMLDGWILDAGLPALASEGGMMETGCCRDAARMLVYPVSSIQYPVSQSETETPITEYRILNTDYRIPNTEY